MIDVLHEGNIPWYSLYLSIVWCQRIFAFPHLQWQEEMIEWFLAISFTTLVDGAISDSTCSSIDVGEFDYCM